MFNIVKFVGKYKNHEGEILEVKMDDQGGFYIENDKGDRQGYSISSGNGLFLKSTPGEYSVQFYNDYLEIWEGTIKPDNLNQYYRVFDE